MAERGILELSAMLREIFAGIGAETWPLARELELVRTASRSAGTSRACARDLRKRWGLGAS